MKVNTSFFLQTKLSFKHIAVLAALCLFAVNTSAKKKTPIYLENSESLVFDQTQNTDAQVLTGNVIFRHDNTRLYCDKAYFYEQSNKLDAFGNVRIKAGDSVTIYGDLLHYDGDEKMGHLKRNVRVVREKSTLYTDTMDYDQANNVGFYSKGGKIVDEEITLTSRKGYFYFNEDYTLFKDNVKLVHPDFTLTADTLRMDNKTKIVRFVGPTNIIYNKETHVYTERGWYDTKTKKAQLTLNSKINHIDGKQLKADTIFMDRTAGKAIARQHVELFDSAQQSTLCGKYGIYLEENKFGLVRDSAYAMEHSSQDTLYIHADTIRTVSDSIYQVMRAIGNVRFFRSNLQGKCDSMVYTTQDSIMNMYEEPVIWSDSAQLCGEFIQAFQKNQKLDYIWVQGWSLAVIQVDTTRYNQIQGTNLKAYVRNNELHHIDVDGNAVTVYYPKEEDGSIVGINRANSDSLTVHMKDKKFNKIVMKPIAIGTLYPEDQIPEDQVLLSRFIWHENIRPKDKYDIFTRYAKSDSKKKRKRIKNK